MIKLFGRMIPAIVRGLRGDGIALDDAFIARCRTLRSSGASEAAAE